MQKEFSLRKLDSVGSKKAVVLMSGGIDSAACAYMLQKQGFDVTAVFIDYGQAAAAEEVKAVRALSSFLSLQLECIKATGPSTFSDGELAGRNSFLAFAALFFLRAPHGLIAMGLHSGTPYFDCSTVFVNGISRLISEQTDGQTSFIAPFVDWNKKDVFEYFVKSGLPLRSTYSCEVGSVTPCGICASCKDRINLGTS